MANLIELKVPDIGGSTDVNVAEVYIKVGDVINVDDNLIMLETDKATMEVPATHAGVVKEVSLKVGSTVNEGDLIAKIESADGESVAKEVTVEDPVVTPAPVATMAASGGSTQLVPIIVPDLSGNNDVSIIDVSVKVGDTINVEDTLITLETDKATMEVPATHAGVVKEIKVAVNGKVNQGDVILLVETTDNAPVKTSHTSSVALETASVTASTVSVANATTAASVSPNNSSKSQMPTTQIDEANFSKAHASPSIRKLARELGTDLSKVKGTGPKGRITESDLKAYIKNVMSGQISQGVPINGSGLDLLPWPKVDFAKFGEVEVKELMRIKKISGANLSRNWIMIPHVTQFDEADITALEEFRKQINEEYKKAEIKVSPLAFIIKACVFALKRFPEFNSSIDGDKIVYKKYYNIGFAADTPTGLVVPVLKDADKKGIIELATESSALAKLARDGKLKPSDMQGGTFTISSLGGIGGTAFTPIVNAPEVAILGISKSVIKPVWNGQEFKPRLMMPMSLSYDHRVIDGALAAKFTTYLSQVLSDVRRLVL